MSIAIDRRQNVLCWKSTEIFTLGRVKSSQQSWRKKAYVIGSEQKPDEASWPRFLCRKDNYGSGARRCWTTFSYSDEDLHRHDLPRRMDLPSRVHCLAPSVTWFDHSRPFTCEDTSRIKCGSPLYHGPLKKCEEVLLQLLPRSALTCSLMCGRNCCSDETLSALHDDTA
jgi:hypothetical protein